MKKLMYLGIILILASCNKDNHCGNGVQDGDETGVDCGGSCVTLCPTTNNNNNSVILFSPGAGVTFDGYTYETIVLENGQEWMAENLRTTKYANGDNIGNGVSDSDWWNGWYGQWCHYNNDSLYENTHGKLYNGYAASDPRNVCPTGWHVPSFAELLDLADTLTTAAGDPYPTYGVAEKMKSTSTQYWQPFCEGTNESGFSAIPSGQRSHPFLSNSPPGGFNGIQHTWSLWSSDDTEFNGSGLSVGCDPNVSFWGNGGSGGDRRVGRCIRCLKD